MSIDGRGSPVAATKGTIGGTEPLLVKPRIAWRMLSCSNTRGYELLNSGELQSFRDGKSRKIVVASIHDYIARRLAAERAKARAPRHAPRKAAAPNKSWEDNAQRPRPIAPAPGRGINSPAPRSSASAMAQQARQGSQRATEDAAK